MHHSIKRIMILYLSLTSVLSYAAKPGVYIGGGISAYRLDIYNVGLFTNTWNGSQSPSELYGPAGRVFIGDNLNRFFGLEAGYVYYLPLKYKANGQGMDASTNYGKNSIDLVGKVYLPLGNSGLNFYGLGGAALVQNTVQYHINADDINIAHGSFTMAHVRPTYGLGTSFDLPMTNFTTSLELSRIQGSGNTWKHFSAIPSTDLLSFNLSYNFG